jgi:osmotically-inducible protein OsmY
MRSATTATLFFAAIFLGGAGLSGAAEPPPDGALKQAVASRMLDARAGFFADVWIDVIGGDALLTGRVKTLQDKARASALVRSVPGVQTVINEIHVGASDDMKRIAEDLLLERQVRAAMQEAFATRLPALNWRAMDGIVYVFGQAKTEWEHNRALAVVKQVQGVAQVVDHLRIVPNGG